MQTNSPVKKKEKKKQRIISEYRASTSAVIRDHRYQRMRFARIHVRSVKLPGNMFAGFGVRVRVCVGNNSDPRVARMREAISLARGMVAHISKDTKETCIQ